MSAPTIKKHRVQRGISQVELARLAKTNVRKIARLEAGTQPCAFDLAKRIAVALDVPVERLFPGSAKLLAKLMGEHHLSNKEIVSLENSGIDGDLRVWTVNIRFRGGKEERLPIDGPDFLRMFDAVQRTGSETFFVFDSEGRRVVLNLDHAVLCHFTFEAFGEHEDDERTDDGFTAKVLLADGSEARSYSLEPDAPQGEEDDVGQVGHELAP